jgi:hypothetical protein
MLSQKRLLISSSLALVSLGLAVTPIQAIFIEQSQSVNASANSSASCTGDCSASSNSSVSVQTSQTMRVDSGDAGYYRPVSYRYHAPARAYVQPVYIVSNSDGQVRLDWGYRGGTCHVRYGEANQSWYKYATAAGCDDGGVTIGGLVPGVKYRFQVHQNEGAWSRAVVVRAQ